MTSVRRGVKAEVMSMLTESQESRNTKHGFLASHPSLSAMAVSEEVTFLVSPTHSPLVPLPHFILSELYSFLSPFTIVRSPFLVMMVTIVLQVLDVRSAFKMNIYNSQWLKISNR